METVIAPLSGARRYHNEFALPPEEAGDFGRQMYDLRSVLLGNPGNYEREIGDSIQRRCPELRLRGTPIPWQAFLRGSDFAQRDVTVSRPGANLVQTFREPRIEDALRPFSACVQSGATLITGLRDNVAIPRWESASSPQALLETAPTTSSTQTASLLNLTPHRISSETILSRQLMRQTENMDLEKLVAREMLASVASTLDGFALNGSGTGGQPTGLLAMASNAPGSRALSKLAPAVTFAGPASWGSICNFVGNVEASDVFFDDTTSWIISPSTRLKWMAAPKISGYPSYLTEDNLCAGYPVRTTSNLAGSNRAVFGRWSSLIVAVWAMSVLVDHVTLSTGGNIRVFLDVFADCGPIYGPAFSASSDAGNQ
jgi:HK97 family phage major capsid protein